MCNHFNENNIWEISRQSRDVYLCDIINQFRDSGQEQTITNCYNYIRREMELSKDGFIQELLQNYRNLIENRLFDSTNDIRRFSVYLTNNRYDFRM